MTSFQYKILVTCVLLVGVVAIWFVKRDFSTDFRYDKASMLVRFSAKEYCSCRFISEQSAEYCRAFVDAEIPILGLRLGTGTFVKVNEVDSMITAHLLGLVEAKALYYPDSGCRLD